MLSSDELSILYKIISDDSKTFENIAQTFSESYTNTDYIKIAISLCILIKDNLLNASQRIISFYLLFVMKKNEKLEISPFLPFIIETIQTTKNKMEQNFLLDFLYNQINYLNTTVQKYMQDNTKIVKINIAHLQSLYDGYKSELNKCGNSNKKNDFIRHILYDRKKSDIKNIDNHRNEDIANSISIENELAYKYFEPNYMSFYPLNYTVNNSTGNGKKFFDMEPIWVVPSLKHNFIWENGNIEDTKNDSK